MKTNYSQVFELSLDALFFADEDFNLAEGNPSFRKLFKYSEAEISGLPLINLFEDIDQHQEILSVFKKKKAIKEIEVALKTKNGKPKTCLFNATFLNDKNTNKPLMLGVLSDLTKRKKVEKQLLRAEKLQMTGKLARTIAHEVRNPLTNLHLALEQLQDEVPDSVEDAALYFDVINRNATRIGNLISELLNSSKPMALNRKKAAVNDVVADAKNMVTDRLVLQEMTCEENYSTNNPKLLLDADQFKIALTNLFINAIEAMEPGNGKLKISTKTEKKTVQILINDNGCGIKPTDLDNLFEPFFSNKAAGTGLGLTTVQNIIHGHDGTISVQSKRKSGTIFTVSLPRMA